MKEKSISSSTIGQFLSLVRASLWQTNVDSTPFKDAAIDWDEIGKLSMQQTVGGLVINAALSLPEDLLPPKEWLHKGYSFMERNRRTHLFLDKCVAEVCSKLKENGITTVLLKGQAYARAYSNPDLRQCGDIDLFVGEKNYFRAYKASLKLGWKREGDFRKDAKHYNCSYKGVDIELHKIAGLLPSHRPNLHFQEWSRIQLNEESDSMIIGKETIKVPSPIFNVVFVFMHMYLHFLNGGIGLRHVCDWTRLLHIHHKDIGVDELEQRLSDFGLLRAWRIFTNIPVQYLGLPEKECPLYSRHHSKEADKILSFILKEGNFGRALPKQSKRPKGYFSGKIYSLQKTTQRRWSKVWIDPTSILINYCAYIYRGTRKVMSDILKNDRNL